MKITGETKERLDSLDLAGKGKTYDMIINDLVTYYQKAKKAYAKNLKKWEDSMKDYEKQVKEQNKRSQAHDKAMNKYNEERKKYNKEKEMWERLLKWAKSKGFKG